MYADTHQNSLRRRPKSNTGEDKGISNKFCLPINKLNFTKKAIPNKSDE
jgi:hypothetical protein